MDQDRYSYLMAQHSLTEDEAVELLTEMAMWGDVEVAHARADDVLLKLINDPRVAAAFESVPRWYA